MANPDTHEMKSANLGTVELHCEFVLGASGAVASVTRGREFLPSTGAVVKQTAAGTYRLFLRERWYACMGVDGRVFPTGAYDATLGYFLGPTGNPGAGGGDQSNTATPYVEIQLMRPDTGAVANGASGDVVKATLTMKYIKG